MRLASSSFLLAAGLGVLLFAPGCSSSGDSSIFDPTVGVEAGSPPLDATTPDAAPPPHLGGIDAGPVTCAPRTCAELATGCGQQGDGCGGIIDCGTCPGGESCGGGGVPSQCGGSATCVPKTCSALAANCGQHDDGCGSKAFSCGTCTAPEFCGGGGHSLCGLGSSVIDGGTCVPTTCAAAGANCGQIGDGCGNLLNCNLPDGGSPCTGGNICGGGIAGSGKPNVCGGATLADGGTICAAATCASLGKNCGQLGDGCGGLTPVCGTCTLPDICGGGIAGSGVANVCGGSKLPDGGAICTPATCTSLGKNCGPVSDGCSGVLDCGSFCPYGQICGGGGTASVCGPLPDSGAEGGVCSGLCLQQQQCDGGTTTTTVTGTVYAPNGTEPLPNAVVYVPNGGTAPNYGVTAFAPNVACNQCGADISGAPLVKAFTNYDGTFTLYNVPVGTNIPMVIQIGRWRRMVTIPNVVACTNNPLTSSTLTRLPRTEGEFGVVQNSIPLTAIATGNVDALECVLRQIGIADSEFTAPTGTGRIRMYTANGAYPPGGVATSWCSGGTPSSCSAAAGTSLIDDPTNLALYDQVLLPCSGDPSYTYSVVNAAKTGISSRQGNMINYMTAGGRAYLTHYSYPWLSNGNSNTVASGPSPFNATATWALDNSSADTQTDDIDTSFPKGAVFAQWLSVVNGLQAVNVQSSTNASPIKVTANGHGLVTGNSVAILGHLINTNANGTWVVTVVDANNFTLNGSTGNGVGAATGTAAGLSPPKLTVNVSRNDMSGILNPPAQRWMSVDPSASWEPGVPEHMTFNTPVGAAPSAQCGRVLYSDFHVSDATTSGVTFPNECGAVTALTPQEKVLEFMLFDLANCITPDVPPTCTKQTCAAQGLTCGPAGDGCGGPLNCGACAAGLTCGGAGVPGACGAPSCTKTTCTALGLQCGPAGDGCGGTMSCGTCPAGQTCGGGGSPGTCGAPSCTKTTCPAQMATCGLVGDGCGGSLNCGSCTAGQNCGGGGAANKCGVATCTPGTCPMLAVCGSYADGCGALLDCGMCPPGQVCQQNTCVTPSCTATTCAQLKATCGPVADGCGGLLDCGQCVAPQTCGGAGTASQCGGGTK